jgi:hypothetical protein
MIQGKQCSSAGFGERSGQYGTCETARETLLTRLAAQVDWRHCEALMLCFIFLISRRRECVRDLLLKILLRGADGFLGKP